MVRTRHRSGIYLSLILLPLLVAPAFGAGFSIFEQGSKAMGMAGAFTAQADDGSAMFHNIGGIGFMRERKLESGLTIISVSDSEFEGADPFPGSGATAAQDSLIFFPAHAYWIEPINDRWTFGFGFNSPFGLATQWSDKNNFPGRFISLRAELRTVDLNPGIGWQVTDKLSIGLGAIARFSDVELLRRVPVVNPFTNTVVDGGSVLLESDPNEGFGWNFGILHKPTDRFSWGFTYRSKIEIDYTEGGARFEQISTGNPQLDAVVASRIPFDQDVDVLTTIDFPDQAILGIAVGLTDKLLIEGDVGWTGWSSFDELPLTFPNNPEFSSLIEQNYDDAYFFRLGARLDTDRGQWRFGYVFDESPQPDEAVGPLLPDADRNGLTVGYGWKHLDLALMFLDSDTRSTSTNHDNFNGTYRTEAWLFGLTYKLR